MSKKIEVNISTKKAESELARLKRAYDEQRQSAYAADKITKEYTKALSALSASSSQITTKLSRITGTIGLSLGFKELIGQAHEANMYMWTLHNSVKDLSDAYGDTGKVMSAVWKAYSSSSVSLSETISIMRGLNKSGLEVNDTISEMAGWIGRVSQASGVQIDALTNLMGRSIRYWNVNQASAKDMVHAVFAAKKVFGITSSQVEELMQVTTNTHEKLAAIFKDGQASSVALTKGITMAAGAMTKLGISSQTATSFIEGLLNPENLAQNTALLRRIGITYRDQVEMMETAGGKEKFFDKLMLQLPKLATELSNIKDPFVRMNVAKNLGIPMEVASKMAGKTSGEIQQMLAEYKEMKKAADVQQQKMQAQQERFDEAKKWLKFNALLPLMEWAQKMYKYMWPFLDAVSNGMQKANKYFVQFLDSAFNTFRPLYDVITGSSNAKLIDTFAKVALSAFSKTADFISQEMPTILQAAIPYIADAVVNFAETSVKLIPLAIEAVGETLRNAFKENIAVGLGISAFLSKTLYNWVVDSVYQFRYIKSQWSSTNLLLEIIGKKIDVLGLKGGSGGGNSSGLGDLISDVADAGVGEKGGKTSRLGKFQKIRGSKIATKTIEGIEAAKKTKGIGTALNIGKAGLKGLQAGSKALLGSGIGSVAGVASTILLAGLQGLSAATNDEYKKDQLQDMTAFEKERMKLLKNSNSKEYKELVERQNKIQEYKKLSAKKEQGIITETEQARLDILEKDRLYIDNWTRAQLFAAGALDGLTLGLTNFTQKVVDANNEIQKSATYFNDLFQASKDIADGVVAMLQNAEKVNDPAAIQQAQKLVELVASARSAEDAMYKNNNAKTRAEFQERQKQLAEYIKTAELENKYLTDIQNKSINKLKMDALNGKISEEQIYKNLAANMELNGLLDKTITTIGRLGSVLQNLWDPKTFNEMQEIRDKLQKQAQEEQRSFDALKKSYESNLAIINNQKPNWYTSQESIDRGKVYYQQKLNELNQKGPGQATQIFGATQQVTTDLVASITKNKDTKATKETLQKQLEQNKALLDSNDQGVRLQAEARKLLLQANLAALDSGATQDQLLANARLQLQLKYKELLKQQSGDNLDENTKKQIELQIKLLASLDKDLETQESNLKAQQEEAKKREKQTRAMLGGVTKIAKNTEKPPAPIQKDYIGNLLRYMGSNVDLRTIGM